LEAANGVEATPAHCDHPCSRKNEKRKSDKDSRPNWRIEGMYIDLIEVKKSNLLEDFKRTRQVAACRLSCHF